MEVGRMATAPLSSPRCGCAELALVSPPHTTLDMSSQTEVDQINAAAGSQVAEFVCAEPDGDALDPSLQNIIDQRQPVLAVLAPCRY